MPFWRSVPAIPCGVEMVVEVAHDHQKLSIIIRGVSRDLIDRLIKLFLRFAKMKKNEFVVHGKIFFSLVGSLQPEIPQLHHRLQSPAMRTRHGDVFQFLFGHQAQSRQFQQRSQPSRGRGLMHQ
jgi:hypothetical protein